MFVWLQQVLDTSLCRPLAPSLGGVDANTSACINQDAHSQPHFRCLERLRLGVVLLGLGLWQQHAVDLHVNHR